VGRGRARGRVRETRYTEGGIYRRRY
jgi:hypothetical protein